MKEATKQLGRNSRASCQHDVWRCCGCGQFYDYKSLDILSWDSLVKSGQTLDGWAMLPDKGGGLKPKP